MKPRAEPKRVGAREVAVRTLRAMEAAQTNDRRGFSNRALFDQLERADLDGRDRGLATHLVYGVLRHQSRIDNLLDSSARDPKSLKGEVRQIARVAALEILELQRPLPIAASAAAELTRRLDPTGTLARFISALLRAMTERIGQEEEWLASASALDVIVRRWSLPRWIARRWIAALGEERALARAQALGAPPWIDLRVDLHRTSVDDTLISLQADYPAAQFVRAGRCTSCIRSRGAGDIFHGPQYEQGLISVQALGSQLAVDLLDPQPGHSVLDACAGMGTKTVHIAERLARRGRVLALDLDAAKLEKLSEQVLRCDLDRDGLEVQTRVADLLTADLTGDGTFDRVLLDAPCTGLGNLGRHPELRTYLHADDIAGAVALQRELLMRVAPQLAPGGRLVYAVCSLEPEEGPQLIRSLLDRCGLSLEGEHCTTPEDDHADGFYAAAVRRVGP